MAAKDDAEIKKQVSRVARLKIERDKSFAVKASSLMREAMAIVEKMDPDPTLSKAAGLMADASDALGKWIPGGSS
jgi:hypothetical protein